MKIYLVYEYDYDYSKNLCAFENEEDAKQFQKTYKGCYDTFRQEIELIKKKKRKS